MTKLYRWLHNIQITALGPRCLLCAAPAPLARELCAACRHDLPWLGTCCLYCALALPATAASDVCPACRRRAHFDSAIGALHYAAPVDWLITRLKFQGRLNHARLLGDLLAARLDAQPFERPDALVPIPLHPAGYRRRGFNQAERIAARLTRPCGAPLRRDVLQRRRDTRRQSELPATRRAANVRDAFVATRALADWHVAIIDDVVTTGHTAAAAARALRAAGCSRVDLYCVARA